MIDLDDFDPLGKQWNTAQQYYQNHGSSEEVADEALRVAAAMLRACGGCTILPSLHDILWEYCNKVVSHTLWSPTLREADIILYEKLEALSRESIVCDKRIEGVALRATMRLALKMKESCPKPLRYAKLGTQLAAFIIEDLIGHSFLDIARAISVGGRFATNEQAFHFYEDVMRCLELGATRMGRNLVRRPTAERLQRYSLVRSEQTTVSMLYDENIIDCEDEIS